MLLVNNVLLSSNIPAISFLFISIKAKIITMLYDGRFVVRYLDGSNDERTVIREQLHDINTKAPSRYWSGKGKNVAKKRKSRRTSFSQGQKLYIKYDGNWHKGVIINEFFDGTFEVQYDEDLVTKRVTRDSLHPLGSPPPSIGGEIIDLSNSTSEDSSSEGSDDEEEDAEENSNGSSSNSSSSSSTKIAPLSLKPSTTNLLWTISCLT